MPGYRGSYGGYPRAVSTPPRLPVRLITSVALRPSIPPCCVVRVPLLGWWLTVASELLRSVGGVDGGVRKRKPSAFRDAGEPSLTAGAARLLQQPEIDFLAAVVTGSLRNPVSDRLLFEVCQRLLHLVARTDRFQCLLSGVADCAETILDVVSCIQQMLQHLFDTVELGFE